MKINKDLMRRFEEWCKINTNYLKKNHSFNTTALIIDKKNNAIIMMLLFRNYEEKEMMKRGLKLFVVSQETKGYFWAADTKLTMMNKDKKPKVYDALVQMLCSPKGSLQRILLHDGKGKKIKIKELSDDSMEQWNVKSEWNVFGESVNLTEEQIEEYNNFKLENPELFKEVQ